jgi:hypothetical protein
MKLECMEGKCTCPPYFVERSKVPFDRLCEPCKVQLSHIMMKLTLQLSTKFSEPLDLAADSNSSRPVVEGQALWMSLEIPFEE